VITHTHHPNLQNKMDLIKGHTLLKADASKVEAEKALEGKSIVLLYFSAHWCPPCRGFTPVLKKFYDEVKAEGVEIIFCSADSSHDDMISYMKESHGDWFAVEHGSKLSQDLDEKFEVSGIPTLVVLKADGTLITKDGRGPVQSKGSAAIKDWQ